MKPITHQDHSWEAWRAGVQTRMLVSARTGATQLCIFEQHVAPGLGAPTHSHPVEHAQHLLDRMGMSGRAKSRCNMLLEDA